MGASQDLLSEGTRRLLVNACYWAIGIEAKIADKSDVTIVGEYTPCPSASAPTRRGSVQRSWRGNKTPIWNSLIRES